MKFEQISLEWMYADEKTVREAIERGERSDGVVGLQQRHAEIMKSIDALENKIANGFLVGRGAMQEEIRRDLDERPTVHVVKRRRGN